MKELRALAFLVMAVGVNIPLLANEPTPVERFYVADGLEATVWAQAPMFFNPTNMDTDAQGRIWVTEAVNYRDFRNKGEMNRWHEEGDRVMVLQDTNGDGRADASHVFVQDKDLVAPMGLSVLDNRIIVTCSPNIIVYTDVNRDARFDPAVDKKQILLTGFGGFDHDHSLHTVKSGPDGDLYFTTGNAGPHIVTDRSGWTLRAGSTYRGGGSPTTTKNVPGLISDDGRVYVGGVAGRMKQDGSDLRIIGHNFRNPYELCLDSFANVFQNDNDDTISCRTTWIMEYSNLGFASNDGERTWRADQRPGQTTPTAHWRQDDPGVTPSGDIYGPGSPTGIEYYENGALGPDYQNMLLSSEAGRNTIWAYSPQPKGAGFELRRSTMFSSTNPNAPPQPLDKNDTRKWFRPTDVMVGADGAVYVADFFDAFIGGHRMLELNAAGAIYRITRKGDNPQPPTIDLNQTAGQISALTNPAHSVRYAGFQRLTEDPSSNATEVLIKLADHDNPRFAARALYALANIGASDHPEHDRALSRVEQALRDENSNLRITAYRALRQHEPERILTRAAQLAYDTSPAVRREVALSLRDVSIDLTHPIIVQLAQGFDGHDRWYLEALGTACEGREETIWNLLKRKAHANPLRWTDAFAAITWRLHPDPAVAPLKQRAMAAGLTPAQRRQAIDALAFIPTRDAGKAVLAAALNGPEDLRSYAAWWVTSRSTNTWKAFGLVEQLPPDPEAIAAAKENKRMQAGRNKLKDAKQLTEELRQTAIDMAKSPFGASHLLMLAGRNELPDFIYPIVVQHIHDNADVSVRALASRFFPKPDVTGQALPPIGDIANLTGNLENGKSLYFGRAACATCHLHGSQGRDIGPNLTGIGQRFNRTAILDSIINPSAAITFGYEAVLIETVEGRAYSGFVIGEGDTLILKDIAGQQHSIPTSSIRSRTKLDQSIMPPGPSLALTAQDLADLVSYLTGAP